MWVVRMVSLVCVCRVWLAERIQCVGYCACFAYVRDAVLYSCVGFVSRWFYCVTVRNVHGCAPGAVGAAAGASVVIGASQDRFYRSRGPIQFVDKECRGGT
jgi:hypothetical protein